MFFIHAQTVDIKGKVVAQDDVEGIHIINKTSQRFTITNSKGEFTIPAKLNDTILVSGIKYRLEETRITSIIMLTKSVIVYLTESIIELNEVVVGKILTGNLLSDIENSDANRDIDFYDVGIPGHTGKRKTQSERRLYEADNGKFVSYYGLGASINIYKILNRISGRTKKLKNMVRLERQDACMNQVKSDFSETLIDYKDLDDDLKAEFFYFASEDAQFQLLCELDDSIKMFEFLQEKLKTYKTNIKIYPKD